MIENNPDDNGNVLCHCSGTTVDEVQALLKDGIVCMDRISRITGACSGCGGCEFELQEMINAAEAAPGQVSA